MLRIGIRSTVSVYSGKITGITNGARNIPSNATQTEIMQDVREQSKGIPWLIPGVGIQGGDLEAALNISNQDGMGIINVSRGILYARNGSIKNVIQAAKNYTEKIRSIIWEPANC